MFNNAKYYTGIEGKIAGITVQIDDDRYICVPIDPVNTDYIKIMELVEKGDLTIIPAEGS
jgi:hypothetical protein